MPAIVKMKIMPVSTNSDLSKVRNSSKKAITKLGGESVRFEEEPIAFGLKAINAIFLWEEEKELEGLENSLKKIKEVKSVEMVDIRRAIG